MSRFARFASFLASLNLATTLWGAASVQAAPAHSGPAVPVCPGPVSQGYARCHSRVFPNASKTPTGLSPATIKSVYNFSISSTAGAGTTIAIVDAYDDPNIESDLGVFSSQYGLPA